MNNGPYKFAYEVNSASLGTILHSVLFYPINGSAGMVFSSSGIPLLSILAVAVPT
jgi:hypothetical protein